MPRKALGPSRLSQILQRLQQEPKPILPAIKSLKLTYAYRNDHFGARHFVKDDLPRIAYVNPSLNITINKILKKPEDIISPEMDIVFRNGSHQKIDMENKWSTTIYKELLDLHEQVTPSSGQTTSAAHKDQRQKDGKLSTSKSKRTA